ncbi:feruloyl esterase-like protein [Dacryopinax primogenitus]|uniref:Carboxylic ester hydrolase n=1 Tax=Dacryopinax primogenitus (strain DJM 731) TaxID=1858805 RepID=M5G827_DACPD|nr:feruloyl esterase-like protein [Dacryopinax primogenitus]EJU06366.1 feruloyl esterase-like protein [Dacryopinax primogenitus]
MGLVRILGLALVSALIQLDRVAAWEAQCASFTLPSSVGNSATLIAASYYPAGALVNVTSSGGAVTSNSLPAFCRVQLLVNTGTRNMTNTEVWLPDAWDGRFLAVGNGGWSGGMVYSDLAYSGLVNGHASMSTDGGHTSSSLDGTWGLNNPEAIVDYAYLSVHISVVVAKEVVSAYYGATAGFKSYWLGCSTGGRQGDLHEGNRLMSVQRYPDDFDGVVVGSPANWISHLQAWSIHFNLLVSPQNSTSWISAATWALIHQEVLNQCDALDGVIDGLLNDPRRCFFRPETLACRPGQDATTCLSAAQINAVRLVFSDYYETSQTYIFGRLEPGGELAYETGLLGANPVEINTDYFKDMVVNDSNWDYTTLNYSTIQLADQIDTYRLDAVNPDIQTYVAAPHNGKVIHYVSWADQLISPGNSLYYYEQMTAFMNLNTNLNVDDYYRLFTVPGMQHCAGGDGPNGFGGEGQSAAGMPPLQPDALHDVLRGMIAWVEQGAAPNYFIATKYVNNTASGGVQMTRPLCKFPTEIVYNGYGDTNNAGSFYCA